MNRIRLTREMHPHGALVHKFYATGPVARAALTRAATGRKTGPTIDTAWTPDDGVAPLRAKLLSLGFPVITA